MMSSKKSLAVAWTVGRLRLRGQLSGGVGDPERLYQPLRVAAFALRAHRLSRNPPGSCICPSVRLGSDRSLSRGLTLARRRLLS